MVRLPRDEYPIAGAERLHSVFVSGEWRRVDRATFFWDRRQWLQILHIAVFHIDSGRYKVTVCDEYGGVFVVILSGAIELQIGWLNA